MSAKRSCTRILAGLTSIAAAAFLCMLLSLSGVTARAVEIAPVVGKTYEESREGQRPMLATPRADAPNVIWILLDDVGFGAASAFGGPIPTPTLESLANSGLRYTNFHTTGICAPTRAALLTGRNHHKVGMGLFPHEFLSAEFPGYTGRLEPQNGTTAEYLREVGYSTYAIGKWHLTPDNETSDLGPFERWPLGKGFDHFFGFLEGGADQYKPRLVEDNLHVTPDGRHLNSQLVDKAIFYIDRQLKLAPRRPFFLYLAPGATHSPHQVDQAWLMKYRGRFDGGWDVARTETFDRQKKLGIVPPDARFVPRDPRVPAWSSLSADQKRVSARFAEAYGAFLEYTDWEIGRLIAYLKVTGKLDDTAIFAVIGDNGSSKEGGANGSLSVEFNSPKKDDAGQVADLLKRIDDIGTSRSFTNYPMGWGQAFATPFQQWKGDANAEGGTRNPLIVSWPRGLPKGEIRGQYGHVIDLLPTAMEVAGGHTPSELHGIKQEPVQGQSLVYSFADARAPSRHTQQYYFLLGAGGIVKDGWKASFGYRPDYVDIFQTYPAPEIPRNNAGNEVWALFDLNTDFNERVDLANKYPDKLKELQSLFATEAAANNVYPLINWTDMTSRIRRRFE